MARLKTRGGTAARTAKVGLQGTADRGEGDRGENLPKYSRPSSPPQSAAADRVATAGWAPALQNQDHGKVVPLTNQRFRISSATTV